MTQNNRTPYQQEMDQIHLSREKADETLRMMLEENQALRRKDIKKAKQKNRFLFTRVLPVLGAAAAVLVLLTTILPHAAYSFGSVRFSSLPVSGTRDTVSGTGFDVFMAQDMFPGWEISQTADPFLTVSAPDGERAVFTIAKDGMQFTVTLSEKETALSSQLHSQPAYGSAKVRLNRDTETGVLSACFQKNELYAVFCARDMAEDAFVRAALAAAEP